MECLHVNGLLLDAEEGDDSLGEEIPKKESWIREKDTFIDVWAVPKLFFLENSVASDILIVVSFLYIVAK